MGQRIECVVNSQIVNHVAEQISMDIVQLLY